MPEALVDAAAPEVTYTVTDGVAVIGLDAGQRRNALTVEMAQELVRAARRAEADPAVGAVVLTGGAHFCSGAVRSVLEGLEADPLADAALEQLDAIYAAFTTVGSIEVPTVAAIRGAAVGAGVNLALATDARIISEGARLIPGFARVGLHPGGGHYTLLNRVAGREAAAAMGLFGETITGERAAALGLAWAAVPDDAVLEAAVQLVAGAAADPPLARRMVKSFRAATRPGGLSWDVALELERVPQLWSLHRRHEKRG